MGLADQFREKAERLQQEARDRLGESGREEPKERGEEPTHRGRETREQGERSMDEERGRREES